MRSGGIAVFRPRYISYLTIGLALFLAIYVWLIISQLRPQEAPALVSNPAILKLMSNEAWINKPYVTRAIQQFEQKTGVKVEVERVPSNSAVSIIKKKFAVNVIPDLVMFYGGAQMNALHPEQSFVNFTEAPWVNDLKPYVVPHITNNFEIYGFPLWEDSINGIIYNRTLFEQLGIEVPTSKMSFYAACERLMNAGVTPFYIGFKDIWPIYSQFGLSTIEQKYPDMVTRLNRNQLKFTDMPEMKDYLNWYQTLADKGYLGSSFSNNSWEGQSEALRNGEYGMAIGSDTYIHRELQTDGNRTQFDLMPFYFGFNETGNYVRNDLIMIYVNANGSSVQQAQQFIEMTLGSLDQIYQDVYTEPLFNSVSLNSNTSERSELVANGRENKIVDAFSSLVIGFAPEEMSVPIQEMLLGRITQDEALRLMEEIRLKNAKDEGTPGF